MWRRIDALAPPHTVRLTVRAADQPAREIEARTGETVATALLAAGVAVFRRSAVSGAPRAPLCLMGACFECLVELDGRSGVQACMVEVAEGQCVTTGGGAARAGDDAPRAEDGAPGAGDAAPRAGDAAA